MPKMFVPTNYINYELWAYSIVPNREDNYEGPLRLFYHNLVAPDLTAWKE